MEVSTGTPASVAGLRVAITGGAGLVGSRVARECLARGAARVTLLDNFVRGHEANLRGIVSDGRVALLRGDLRDAGMCDRLLEDVDVLFHFAALRIPRCEREPGECASTMVAATHSLFAKARARSLRRTVFASSNVVYGRSQAALVGEDEPLKPTTLYGIAKVAGEQMLAACDTEGQLDHAILRFFNVYGPGMGRMGPDAEVLVLWMDALAEGRSPEVHEGGQGAIDLVHVDDVASACLAALLPAASRGTFNIASGTPTPLADLAALLARVSGTAVQPVLVPSPAGRTQTCSRADIGRARRCLGFAPRVPLEEGLADLYRWYAAERAASGEAAGSQANRPSSPLQEGRPS